MTEPTDPTALPTALTDLIGEEVDVLHCTHPDPDRGGDGMVAFRGVLLEVTGFGLTLDGDDREEYDDTNPSAPRYRSFVPWGGFLRVEAVDAHPV